MEYLVTMTTHVPDGTTAEAVSDVRARESAHTRELAAQGYVLRLWRPPLAPGGADEMAAILESLPQRKYLTTRTTALTPHPSDPGAPGSRARRTAPTGADHG